MNGIPLVRKLLFWTLQLLIALVVLELCARGDDWLTWQAPFWGEYDAEMLFVTDSLGYHLRPNGRFQKWQVNSHGFRGPEITVEKPAGVRRIITVGASETFGLYESPGKEFPAQLQSLLDQQRPGKYQVLNAGIPGISPSRIGHYFETWLRRFSPDIVIYYPTPSFILVPPEAPQAWTRQQESEPGFRFSPRIIAKIRDLYKRIAPQPVQTYVRQLLVERAVRSHPAGWVLASVPPERVGAFREALVGLAQLVRANGSEIVFATHGSRIARGDTKEERALLVAWRNQWPNRTEACLMEMEVRTNEVITELGARHQIPVADINSRIPKSAEYFADFVHFTDSGAALAARSLMSRVLEMEAALRRRVDPPSIDSATR